PYFAFLFNCLSYSSQSLFFTSSLYGVLANTDLTHREGHGAKELFDFTEFEKQYIIIYPNNKLPSYEFLTWFIGFVEGDGSFIIRNRNDFQFVITQSSQDLLVLEYIYKNLGLGKIIKQGKRTHRLIVQDINSIYLIILLFNGNIVLPSRKRNFKKFIDHFNLKINLVRSMPAPQGGMPAPQVGRKIKYSYVKPMDYDLLPSTNNSWIAGFTDAEGCFTVSFLSVCAEGAEPSNAFRLRYIVSQKGDINLPILSHFILLFKAGKIEAHSIKSNYSYILSGEKNCYNIYDYFENFPLKSKKFNSFKLWKEIHLSITNKQHFNVEMRKELVEKAKTINRTNRKSK
uniref:LAGLIDADG endonuclease n=1 Tax=Ramaria rubella TaxID=113071 RepID=UPI002238A6E0